MTAGRCQTNEIAGAVKSSLAPLDGLVAPRACLGVSLEGTGSVQSNRHVASGFVTDGGIDGVCWSRWRRLAPSCLHIEALDYSDIPDWEWA